MEHLNVPPANHVKVLDGQGWVGLIDHLGSEATIVNAARYRARSLPIAGALLREPDRGEEQMTLL